MEIERGLRVELTRSAATATGAGLLGYGAWLHYPPLGFATAGAVLLLAVLIGMWRAR